LKTAESLSAKVLTCWDLHLDQFTTSGQQSERAWNCHQIHGLPAEQAAAGKHVNKWQDLQGKLERYSGFLLKIFAGDEMWD
jgi:hypothetical protein